MGILTYRCVHRLHIDSMFYICVKSNYASMNDTFYTVEQAATLLGISERVLRDKINKGEIKASKKFGRWYVFHADLAKAIKSNQD